MNERYEVGQEVEVKRATHDGWVWVAGRVIEDTGEVVRVSVGGRNVPFSPDSVRKPGEDKA